MVVPVMQEDLDGCFKRNKDPENRNHVRRLYKLPRRKLYRKLIAIGFELQWHGWRFGSCIWVFLHSGKESSSSSKGFVWIGQSDRQLASTGKSCAPLTSLILVLTSVLLASPKNDVTLTKNNTEKRVANLSDDFGNETALKVELDLIGHETKPLERVFTANESLTLKDILKNNKPVGSKASGADEVKRKNESATDNLDTRVNANKLTDKKNSSDVVERHADIEEEDQKSDTIQIGQTENVTFLIKEEDITEAANFGLQAMNDLYNKKEPSLYNRGLFLDADNPARYVAAFNDQTEEARMLARFGYATVEAAKAFKKKFPEISRQGPFIPPTPESDLHRQCPKRGIPQCKTASLKYRTADGSCNNPQNLWWGSSMSPMQRFMPAVYQDGIESVRLSVTGIPLPSARDISNFIHEDKDIPLASVTHMLMQWGQFVDHDITATGQSRGFNGSVPQCCARGGVSFQPPELMHPECLPIAVSGTDTFFRQFGVRCLEFIRSTLAPKEGCEFSNREQINQVTSFLDASTVYSSSTRQSDSLRLKRNGLLQYGQVQSQKPVLPKDNSDVCKQNTLATSCFKAGDGRLNENPALTSLHIVFLRLHNRIATQLSALNQHWNDERLFQETRKIIGAIVQHITYREYLPIVLGPDVMKIFDLEVLNSGYYTGYDVTVNPDIANEFSTAAYRFGHSLVQKSFYRFDSSHRLVSKNVTIHEEFSNPSNLHSPGSLDRIILGLINQPSQRRDEFIVDELTNHLFQTPRFPFGMDLASLNIQRGRDHGIPAYVQWRVPCDLSPIRNWEDFEIVTSTSAMIKFRALYASVEDVDLFSAGLAEKPLKGGLVGPTFACIIAQQFSNLRKGDRFWFENSNIQNSFTLPQLKQVRSMTLAQVLCRTMDNVDSVQPFVMLVADNRRNQRRFCRDRSILSFSLDPWIESETNIFKNVPLEEEKFTDEQIKIIDQESLSRVPVQADNKGLLNQKFQNPFSKPPDKSQERLPPYRPRPPLKTKINQQNRIAVKRPLGPGENVTIFVQNNAVNAPIIVQNAQISNSNIQINQASSTSQPDFFHGPNSGCQLGSCQSSNLNPVEQIPKPISKPPDGNPAYTPFNYHDPNNPNPLHYGFSSNPANNYIPNNLYFYSMMKPHLMNLRPIPIESLGNLPYYHSNLSQKPYSPQTEVKQNEFNGWFNVTSTSDSYSQPDTFSNGQLPETYNEDLVNPEKPLPSYRFDNFWNEKKSTIEELIQHTNLPPNPVGLIDSEDGKKTSAMKKEGNGTDEVGIDQEVQVGDTEMEWKMAEEDKKVTGVFYFDKNILNKYPGGGRRLDRDVKDDNKKPKINVERGFDDTNDRIKVNRLSGPKKSSFPEMPAINSDQTVYATEVPKPMKFDIYL